MTVCVCVCVCLSGGGLIKVSKIEKGGSGRDRHLHIITMGFAEFVLFWGYFPSGLSALNVIAIVLGKVKSNKVNNCSGHFLTFICILQ